MKILTKSETAAFLLKNDRYVILTHRKPDGDTLGSAAALCLGLRQLGKEACILSNPEIGARLTFLGEGMIQEETNENDILIAVDVAAPGMLPKCFAPYAEWVRLRIDHHGSATSFAERELVDPDSASCAEMIWDLLVEMGVRLSRKIANALYVGISTDNGCFRYANTTDHTFRTAAACAEAGAEVFRLNQMLFETNSLAKLRMHAWIAENLRLFDGGKKAIVAIPRAVEDLIGVTEEDMDNISSFPRTIEGVCMAATLRQTKEGITKISLRAVPGYDAAAVCAHFGGGGHKGAAGGSTSASLEETAKQLEEIMLNM